MIVFGFDPGGKNSSGAAVWRLGTPPLTSSHKSVDAALDWFKSSLEGQTPTAVGIDTLLCWQTGPSGWREPDRFLRTKHPAVAKSVVASNSLYGSMAVQGMAMAIRLRDVWPDIELNETHPKVLYFNRAKRKYEYDETMIQLWARGRFHQLETT